MRLDFFLVGLNTFQCFSHYLVPAKVKALYIRVITILTDLAADLTQDVLLGTDQRLLKPFFDIPKNRGEATSQS